MLSYIVVIMSIIAVIFSIVFGRGETLLTVTLEATQDAVTLCISLGGMMALWGGLFRVADRAGITKAMAKLMRPLTRLLFGGVSDPAAMRCITANIVANFIGIGNAATPAGLEAMRRMGALSGGAPTRQMALFCVLNSASIQVVPTTVIGLRAAAGAITPADVLPCVWLTSAGAAIIGICMVCVLSKRI